MREILSALEIRKWSLEIDEVKPEHLQQMDKYLRSNFYNQLLLAYKELIHAISLIEKAIGSIERELDSNFNGSKLEMVLKTDYQEDVDLPSEQPPQGIDLNSLG